MARRRLKLIFSPSLVTEPVIYQLGKQFAIVTNIRRADVTRDQGWVLLEITGEPYSGGDPDGYMNREELVDHFQDWSDAFKAPLKEGCSVTSLDRDGDGFTLRTEMGDIEARTVVVATGGYQRPHLPRGASEMPAGLTQVLAEEYRNTAAVPE